MEDEGLSQNVGTIQGATDDIFYQMSNYNFSAVYDKARGLNSDWQTTYVNGIRFNDPLRGQFSFSSLGGMTSTAFRQRTTTLGSDAAAYGYGSIGGSSNVTTYASEYAPGFRGSVAYTNSNYMLRVLFQYNSGLNKNGWAFSASVIGRYADQGVIAGTFYNSVGYSLSLQKVFNSHHSLNLSTWGAPTQRATAKATTKEAYELAGSNLYNPSWGWLNGKKISSRITETFDPTVTLNWIWKPKDGTTLNTGFAFRHNGYVRSDVTWYNTYDPRPDYYRNFPSYYAPTAEPGTTLYDTQMAQYDYMTDMWRNDESWRHINFDQMYQTNLLNRNQFVRDPDLKGQSSYMLNNKHSNFTFWSLNSTLSHRLNNMMSLQGGVSFNYTDGHYYKTVRDLLGGLFWRDVDSFSERDFAGNQDILQNDLNNPNRKVTEGEVFGYDYNIHNYLGHIWAQNQINTRHWNLFYAVEADFTSFQRIGHMRNGRAPEDSYGKGKSHSFVTGAGKTTYAEYEESSRRYILDSSNNSLMAYNSGYSTFYNDVLPEGTGSVEGILSYYGFDGTSDPWQLLLRSTQDVSFGDVPGTKRNPYGVADVIALDDCGLDAWAEGYIVGAFDFSGNPVFGVSDDLIDDNVLIAAGASCKDVSECVCVQLPAGSMLRQYANLLDNPGVIGKKLTVNGSFAPYYKMHGILVANGSKSEFSIEGVDLGAGEGNGSADDPYTVEYVIGHYKEAEADVWMTGYIVGFMDGQAGAVFGLPEGGADYNGANVLVASDPSCKDVAKCVYMKCNRNAVGLKLNPDNLGKKMKAQGGFLTQDNMAGFNASSVIIE